MSSSFQLRTSVAIAMALLLSILSTPGFAWEGQAESSCTQQGGYFTAKRSATNTADIEVRLAPGVANPLTELDPVDWTAGEKEVIQIAIGTFNQISTARIHLKLTSTACSYNATPEVATICLWKNRDTDKGGSTMSWLDTTACVFTRSRIYINEGGASDVSILYHNLVHEFSHALGVAHSPNEWDWMSSSYSASVPFGGGAEHLGMTRDTRNALSYLYPFGHNFFFGHFDQRYYVPGDLYPYRQWLTDILTRDAQLTGDTVPWYLASQGRSVGGDYDLRDEGESSDDGDFGNANSLPYVVGNFTGSGGDDVAVAMSSAPHPGDGAIDVMAWWVMKSTTYYLGYFDSSAQWIGDFGDAEDFEMYFAGDFNGASDGCDDLLMIRNLSDYDCDSSLGECSVRLYVAPSVDGDSDGSCEGTAGWYYYDVDVSERSATTAWPWVVGDFYTADGLGCADVAYGETNQTDPAKMYWYVIKGKDTNSDGVCDSLEKLSSAWTGDMGDQGQVLWFAGDFGYTSAQDLVRVKVTSTEAQWYVAYSNGSNMFTYGHTPVSNMWVGADVGFSGMIFGVGNFKGADASKIDDFVALVDNAPTGDRPKLRAWFAYNTGGYPQSAWIVYSDLMPNAKSAWNQATDWDDWNTSRDNGGDDVRYDWWCSTCDEWYNLTK